MIKYLVLLLLLCSFLFPSFAQTPVFKISGQVIDGRTKQPLANVSIQVKGTQKGSTTNSRGFFELSIKKKEAILIFSFIGYEKAYIPIKGSSLDSTIVELVPKIENLKEFTINSSPLDTVNKNTNVFDYQFYDDYIFLITYIDDLSKSKLVLIDSEFEIVTELAIDEKPTRLFKDCLGNNHLICGQNAFQIFYDNNTLRLIYPIKTEEFNLKIEPCIGMDSKNFYFYEKYGARQLENNWFKYTGNNHIINYYYIDKFSKQRNNLTLIQDEATLALQADEKRFSNSDPGSEFSKAASAVIVETKVFKEIYVPLYIIHDTTYIFDYINSKIRSYSSGKKINELDINFHTKGKWKREMTIDNLTNKVYTIFNSSGITELTEINIKNGELKTSNKLPFIFVENIKSHNGYHYFLHRGEEYGDQQFLSRLRID